MRNGEHFESDEGFPQDDDDTNGNLQPSDTGLSGGLGPLDTRWRLALEATPSSSSLSGQTPARTFGFPTGPDPQPFGFDAFDAGVPPERPARPTPPPPSDFAQNIPGALFAERYAPPPESPPPGREGLPDLSGPATRQPTRPEEGNSMRYQHSPDDHLFAALQQRRLEDERRTGRRWPTNSLTAPGNLHEAMYFQGLAIALGHVDPRSLARESALRYVHASRLAGESELAPTDIYSIIYYGLGLTIRPLDCTGLPHVLAVYHRATREIYLDWQLLTDPPAGRAILDPSAWRRSVDSSQIARFLLAWCAAVHLTDNYDMPLVLGFSPAPRSATGMPQAGMMGGLSAPMPPTLSGDTMNRYRKAMEAAATLLAPAERLWQQVLTYNRRMHVGDPNWRAEVRSEMMRAEPRYQQGGWQQTGAPALYGMPANDYPQPAMMRDPVEQFVASLAETNNCPPLLVEQQLDGEAVRPDWAVWASRLLRELPQLQMRYAASARMFGMTAAGAMPMWGGAAPAPAPQAMHAQLSL